MRGEECGEVKVKEKKELAELEVELSNYVVQGGRYQSWSIGYMATIYSRINRTTG